MLRRLANFLRRKHPELFWSLATLFVKKGYRPPIRRVEPGSSKLTPVDLYWERHTVRAPAIRTAAQSEQYLAWRFKRYPLFQQLAGLYGTHDDQVILDYGCGPGNDLVGFLLYTGASKVVGIDTSAQSLSLAARRLSLHHIEPARIELIQLFDSEPKILLENGTIDYLQSLGVLHHVSHPQEILDDFHRLLKPGGSATIMVYNRNSIWLHLHIAYAEMILKQAYPGLGLEPAFARSTDGVDCPISRCYSPEEFLALVQKAGFKAQFAGGYFHELELSLLQELREQALADPRLAKEHKTFLQNLSQDQDGYPLYQGLHAGIGGIYQLRKKEAQ
jgi:SAM-dependent methyltransferase